MWIYRRESHFYGEIGHYVLVGEVPSVASALPSRASCLPFPCRIVIKGIDSIGESHEGGSRRGAPRRYKDPAFKAHQNRPAGRVGTGMRAIPHPGHRCARSFAARMAEEGLLSNAA